MSETVYLKLAPTIETESKWKARCLQVLLTLNGDDKSAVVTDFHVV